LATMCVLSIARSLGSDVTVYYASGFANHVSFKGSFEVVKSVFDRSGHVVSNENITSMDAFMMGYVRVSPDKREIIFAAQTKNQTTGIVNPNVRLFQAPLDQTKPPSLLMDESALLAPCAHKRSPVGAGPCTQADVFHPYYDDTGDSSGLIAFAYRAWDRSGLPAGNQALALLGPGGTVRPLTFNSSDIDTSDECPRFVPGSNGTQLVFVRVLLGARHMAHLDITTGAVAILSGPVLDGWGGCAAVVGSDFLFLTTPGKTSEMEAVSTSSVQPFSYRISPRFKIAHVNTTGAVDALALQYCSHISTASPGMGTATAIACKTQDEVMALVDATTGAVQTKMVPPRPTWVPVDAAFNWCLTPNSFHVWGA